MSETPETRVDRPDPMEFGRSLAHGLGVNLLVRDVQKAAQFQAEIFGVQIIYCEEHFAILRHASTLWMLHSDWSYRNHEFRGAVEGTETRGAGVELRLYGVDPDRAEAQARRRGALVLAGSANKPHGLREAYIVDDEGYVFVPCVATRDV